MLLYTSAILLPGWDSIDTVTKIHRFFEVGGIVCLAVLVLFEAVAYIYGHRRDVLAEAGQQESLRQALDEGKKDTARLESEAKTAREALQETAKELATLKEKDLPRSLSDADREKLLATLKKHKGYTVIVRHSPSLESQSYEEQILAVLVAAGWTRDRTPFRIIERDAPGVLILVKDANNAPEGASVLQNALKVIGIEANGVSVPTVADGAFELYVGPKPSAKH